MPALSPGRPGATGRGSPGPGESHVAADADLAELAATAQRQMAAENFPVAARAVPRAVRADLTAVYRFARFVDDVGDEAPGGAEHRLALLERIAGDLAHAQDGSAALDPVAGLRAVLDRVPLQPFLDLVEANRVDQRVTRYETFEDLLGYCALSAAPVGRIVLHLAGAATDERLARSDAVCAALQVLEHCQDLGEDARNGRIYLPAAELREHAVDSGTLTGDVTSQPARRVVGIQVARARTLLAEGRGLVGGLRGWARVAVAGYVAGGLATADALERAGFAVLEDDVRPSKPRTALIAAALAAGLPVRSRGRGRS